MDFRGSVWTQRLKWGKENMAPAIRASLAHYGRVVTVVVGTCLGDHRMKAPDRARVLEHWVMVAKVSCEPRQFPLWTHGLVSSCSALRMAVWGQRP